MTRFTKIAVLATSLSLPAASLAQAFAVPQVGEVIKVSGVAVTVLDTKIEKSLFGQTVKVQFKQSALTRALGGTCKDRKCWIAIGK